MEPFQKVYVSPDFLKTPHGEIGCEVCHGGDPSAADFEAAHRGVVADPTYPDPSKACGECHEDVAKGAAESFHYHLGGMLRAVETRASEGNHSKLRQAFENHCLGCHASCGQCHISRPDYVEGGFLAAHRFQKTPPMDQTCAACHGGRVYGEFTGAHEDLPADVHFEDQEMSCADCHKADQMHVDASKLRYRWDNPHRPRCTDCHEEVVANPANKAHKIHGGKLACQVCHSVAYKNCFSCHVGLDKKGLPYFKAGESKLLLKIGLNPQRTEGGPEYVLVRRPPVLPTTFDFYGKGLLDRFSKLPTWKPTAPHTIQRVTPQSENCNNCHGHPELFLREGDLQRWEREANSKVVVPDGKIPKALRVSGVKR